MAIHNDPREIAALYDAKFRDSAGLNAILAQQDGRMFNHNGLVLPERQLDLDWAVGLDEPARLALLHELEIDLVRVGLDYLGGIAPTDRVLDAGCGGGGGAVMVVERFGCEVQGVTLSGEQARFATEAARARGLQDEVRFAVADMVAYCRQNGPFGGIWACESTEHVDDLASLLATFHDGLEPAARAVIIAWCAGEGPEADRVKEQVDEHYKTNLHTPDAYRSAAAQAELVLVDQRDLTSDTALYWEIRERSAHRTGSERFMTPAFARGLLSYWLFALAAE